MEIIHTFCNVVKELIEVGTPDSKLKFYIIKYIYEFSTQCLYIRIVL